MSWVKRLTPIVPGEMQPAVFVDGRIREGYFSGEATNGLGFPQYGLFLFGHDKVHYWEVPHGAIGMSLCGLTAPSAGIYLPGNYPRCKKCVKAYSVRKKYGIA